MSVIGVELDYTDLFVTRGRDFRWVFQNFDENRNFEDFPPGDLFFEFQLDPLVVWEFVITGHEAALKVESVDVDVIPDRTNWQLVFIPSGELAGGTALARGRVFVQL